MEGFLKTSIDALNFFSGQAQEMLGIPKELLMPIHPNCRCKVESFGMSQWVKKNRLFKKPSVTLITKWVNGKAILAKRKPKKPTLFNYRRAQLAVRNSGFKEYSVTI